MQKRDVEHALFDQRLIDQLKLIDTMERNRCLATPGLAIGTTSKKAVRIVNTTTYLSDGVFKSKSAAEVAFTATSHDIAANASTIQEAVYLLTLAANGDATITKGATVAGAGNAKLPERPATGTPIGYVRIAVAAGSTPFDATSDDLDAAHLTVTYTNVGVYGPKFDVEQ